MRWVVVGALALATGVHASPWLGFSWLASAPSQGVQLRAQLRVAGTQVRGRITACAGDGPCPLAAARLALDAAPHAPAAREQVDRLRGTITLDDGTACTFTGDVWRVEVRGRRIPRGALHGQVACPTIGLASLSMWVKGFRQPPSDGG
jgi:hypothetical protein